MRWYRKTALLVVLLVLLTVPTLAAEDGWVHVKTDVIEGYVMASFITKVEEAPAVVIATPAPPTPSPAPEQE